jgi:SAM-dependent methyltransferase
MTLPDKPPHQNPDLPDFWDHRFRNAVTPWDAGGVPAALAAFARGHQGGRRVLIPGCGTGWEARHLAERGFDVTALDFSAEAIAAARATLGPHAHCLVHADFFAFDPGSAFDVVYERTFLCALPRRRWPQYAGRVASLLKPRGVLAGFFFFGDEPKGPPFGTRPEGLESLLGPFFAREDDRAVDDSIPLFRGRERWQVWRRRDD